MPNCLHAIFEKSISMLLIKRLIPAKIARRWTIKR